MGIWILIGFAVLAFALLTFLRKYSDSFMLIAFAIGTAVNANIFHSGTYPVVVGNIVFSIDSILYTIFMFTVAVKYIHYPRKDGQSLVYATIAAILIAAVIECAAKWSSGSKGGLEVFEIFLNYLFSSVGTLISCSIIGLLVEKLKDKKVNNYLTVFISILIGTVINSVIYFGGMMVYNSNDPEMITKIGWMMLGNLILKIVCIVFAELSYLVSNKWWIPNELKNKQ